MRTSVAASAAALASIVVLATSADAQLGLPTGLINGLGVSCLGGLASLLTNQDLNNCLKVSDAVTGIGALGSNDSIVPAVNTYLSKSLCPADVCSNATLSSANSTIGTACSSEIESDSNFLPSLLQLIMTHYTEVKTGSCLADTRSNDQLCIAQTLTSVQTTLGQNLTLTRIQQLSSNTEAVTQFLERLSSNSSAFCTDCNRGILATLSPALTDYLSNQTLSGFQQAISQGCGANFLMAGVPSDLKQTGKLNGSSGSSSSGGSNDGFSLQAAPLFATASVMMVAGVAALL